MTTPRSQVYPASLVVRKSGFAMIAMILLFLHQLRDTRWSSEDSVFCGNS